MAAPDDTTRPLAPLVVGAAAASMGAGLVHAAAAGTHAGADTLVRLFAAAAAVQVLWAVALLVRPSRGVAVAGAVVNGAAVLAWALSRTRGLPWPAELEAVESVGTQDLVAAVLGGLAAALALAFVVRPALSTRTAPPGLALLGGAVALALAVPGMAAAHTHGPSHEHGHGAEGEVAAGHDAEPADHEHAAGDELVAHVEGDDHSEADHAAAAAGGPVELASGPVISLDDDRVTDAERAAAQDLIDRSTAAMALYSDTASVEAAGYVSIGDAVTGYEHFVSVEFLADGIELDPARVESIVFEVLPDGTKALASAMFILNGGRTMADVPDIAGELTTWHDHQNLCWEGIRVVGTLDETGTCPRGQFRPTPPMLHVWMREHPCGPFAGLEGSHGAGCGEHGH